MTEKEILDHLKTGQPISNKIVREIIRIIQEQRTELNAGWGLVMSLCRIMGAPDYSDIEYDLEHLVLDAERWRALMKTDRLEFVGSAELGSKSGYQHLVLQLWHGIPKDDMLATGRFTEEMKLKLITYTDTIRVQEDHDGRYPNHQHEEGR